MPAKKTKSKIKEFELSEEFQEKYLEITRIYTKDKNLVLELRKGGLVISKYYSEDIKKTLDTLEKEFLTNMNIEIEFTDNLAKEFLRDFAQMLGRRLIQDSQEEEEQNEEQQQEREDQQHKFKTIQEVKALRLLHPEITLDEWLLTLQQKHDTLYNTVQEYMPDIWLGLDFTLSLF